MQQYVRKYKDDALGVGDVMLPEEVALVQAGGDGGSGVGAGVAPGGRGAEFGRAGADGGAGGAGLRLGDVSVGLGTGAGGNRPGVRPGSLGPLGVGLSTGLGPAGGATGTTATAGAMSHPGAQQAGLPQQTFVSSLFIICPGP